MNELIVIKHIILNREIYDKYYRFLNLEYIKNTYKELTRVLLLIESWYKEEKSFKSIDDFKAIFFNTYPALKKPDVEYYHSIFGKIASDDTSPEALEEVLEGHRKRAIASEIADLAWGIANGQREFLELPAALERVSNDEAFKAAPTEIEFVTDDLEELYQTTYAQPGYKWRIKTLRTMMGSLRKGDFGFIFARPEVGKTTFLADQLGYMALQTERGVLHFNNEEFGNKVKIRYIQAMFGVGTRDLFDRRKEFQVRYLRDGGSKIKIVDKATIWKKEVEEICEAVQPEIIVFDSIDKIAGFQDDRDDLVYKQIYQWARELAKVYGPVIGVCHAAQSGEGTKYLEMDDVAYAKTAKQGEADWILGIGKSHDPLDEKRRFLHLCKNKLLGDDEMDEDLRHGRLPVKLYADIARYDDELEFE